MASLPLMAPFRSSELQPTIFAHRSSRRKELYSKHLRDPKLKDLFENSNLLGGSSIGYVWVVQERPVFVRARVHQFRILGKIKLVYPDHIVEVLASDNILKSAKIVDLAKERIVISKLIRQRLDFPLKIKFPNVLQTLLSSPVFTMKKNGVIIEKEDSSSFDPNDLTGRFMIVFGNGFLKGSLVKGNVSIVGESSELEVGVDGESTELKMYNASGKGVDFDLNFYHFDFEKGMISKY